MSLKSFTRSFAGGEIAPQLYGRLDLAKFQTGLAKCENFLVTPQGPIENRPGFEYVLTAKTAAVLIPFSYNSEQSFALEFGIGYIRFHTQGATLLEASKSITAVTIANQAIFSSVAHGYSDGDWVQLASMGGMTSLSGRWGIISNATANAFRLTDLFGADISTVGTGPYTGGGTVSRVYEVVTPYLAADLFDLHYVQSADVLTLVHQDYTPRELRRLSATSWTLTAPSFSPTTITPAAPTIDPAGPGGGTPEEHKYVVTGLATETLEESLASPSVSADLDLTVVGNYISITPPNVAGVVRYNVYKYQSGIYGYIGQSNGETLKDTNISPDMSKTPPLINNPFVLGAIDGVTATNGGSGYNTDPDTGGGILSVTVTAGGTGYTAPVAIAIGGAGSGATFTVTQIAGVVVSVAVNTPGSLYESPISIVIADAGGGTGTGATATCTASPTIPGDTVELAITDPDGSGAEIEAIVVDGEITSVRLIAAGSGYTSPSVTVTTAAGGSGATFDVTTSGDDVNPQAVGYYEQRRCFGGSGDSPQHIWMTRSGTERNMTYSIPTQDDDAITARIVAREANVVRHLVPLNDLLALTSGGVWRISTPSGEALTPANLSAKPQSYVGASMVQPVVTNSSILYAPDRGAHIREIAYKWESQSYQAEDASVLAPHLFDYETVVQMSYSQTPYQITWVVRGDGVLLGMTYQPEHQIKAWHQHTTDGTFESVCAIPEGDEDGVYVIAQREINGQNVRYIERMHSRRFATLRNAFFVDAGLTYRGADISTITGLWHLEGATVVALADGGVEPAQVVTNGSITLTAAAGVVHVGLAYNCDAQTLPFASEAAAAFGQGLNKNVNEVSVRLLKTSGISIGPTFDDLLPVPQRTVTDDYGAAPAMMTGMYKFRPTPKWQQDGSVCVSQENPLPVTLESMTLEVATGG